MGERIGSMPKPTRRIHRELEMKQRRWRFQVPMRATACLNLASKGGLVGWEDKGNGEVSWRDLRY